MLPVTGNEVRLVLEANVRATQMAFTHNERTLSASLKMAETLRDGIQVLAQSQAEWIKSISSARGFFRNAAMAQLPPPEPKEPEEDEDDDEIDETPMPRTWADTAAEVLTRSRSSSRPSSWHS